MADDDEIVEGTPTGEPEAAATEQAPEPEAAQEQAAEPEAAATEEPQASEAEPESDGDAAEATPAPAAPPRAEPQPILAPKERRRRMRAAKAPAARSARTAQERQAERDAERAKKAHARSHDRARARAEKPASTAAPAEPVEHSVGRPKMRQGVVTSDKADKTITVRVDSARRHLRYKKIVRHRTTFHAHDERNEAHEGDLVRIVESRPLSATKRWRLVEVLERAK